MNAYLTQNYLGFCDDCFVTTKSNQHQTNSVNSCKASRYTKLLLQIIDLAAQVILHAVQYLLYRWIISTRQITTDYHLIYINHYKRVVSMMVLLILLLSIRHIDVSFIQYKSLITCHIQIDGAVEKGSTIAAKYSLNTRYG